MREHQRSLLEPLLKHARANVPFYEERLDPIFSPTGEISWERWREIPILTRADLLKHRRAMQASVLPPSAGKVGLSRSSGTTGLATVTTHNALAMTMSGMALYRTFDWYDLDLTKTWLAWEGENAKVGIWPDGDDRGPWAPPWQRGDDSGALLNINFTTRPEQVIEFAMRHGARYLSGGGVRAQLLALESRRQNLPLELDVIFTRGSAMSEDARALIADVFGARVIPQYSSKEGHRMAAACPDTAHYHVNAELLLLEVLDEAGNPCAAGETGRVIVTPFFSMAQPLIRYDMGDLATAGGACVCGRTLPVLSSIDGRQIHIFQLPDGRRVVPTMPVDVVGKLHAAVWQMAQTGPGTIEIRYLPLHEQASPEEDIVKQALGAVLHPELEISFKRWRQLDLPPSGKLVQYAREWSDA